MTPTEAEERGRKLPAGYKYVEVPPAKVPSSGTALPPIKLARGASLLLGQRNAGHGGGDEGTQLGFGAVQAADVKQRLELKKKLAELSALVDVLAGQVTQVVAERPPGDGAGAAPASSGSGRLRGTDAVAAAGVVWGEQTLEAKLEASRTKRFVEIATRQGLVALKTLMQHKWSWPFVEPVNAEKMGLLDYHTIIKQPMDLGTVRTRLEAGAYHHPNDVADDIRLVFRNAKTYNPAGSDVHVMAATLEESFEGKWAAAVEPRIAEATAACEAEAHKAAARAAEAERMRHVEFAERRCRELERVLENTDSALTDTGNQLCGLCAPLTVDEKRTLLAGLRDLAPEGVKGAVQLVAGRVGMEEVDMPDVLEVDVESQDTLLLRRLLQYLETAPKGPGLGRRGSLVRTVSGGTGDVMPPPPPRPTSAGRGKQGPAAAALSPESGEQPVKRKRGRPKRKRDDEAPSPVQQAPAQQTWAGAAAAGHSAVVAAVANAWGASPPAAPAAGTEGAGISGEAGADDVLMITASADADDEQVGLVGMRASEGGDDTKGLLVRVRPPVVSGWYTPAPVFMLARLHPFWGRKMP